VSARPSIFDLSPTTIHPLRGVPSACPSYLSAFRRTDFSSRLTAW